jgi:putative ABC transport system permease protein
MFGRLLWKLLRSNRGRLTVALVAVISGAAVISALLTVELDISRKLTSEFSLLGPNILVTPNGSSPSSMGATAPTLMDESVIGAALARIAPRGFSGSAPFLYIVGRVNGAPVVVAGTHLKDAVQINPTWRVDDPLRYSTPVYALDNLACYVGRNVARQLTISPEQTLNLRYGGREVSLHVLATLDTGAAEDDQILADLGTVQTLAGVPGQIEAEQIRVSGTAPEIASYSSALAAALDGYNVQPIRAVTLAEGNLLNRTRLLVFSMVALILALTALCVLATMAALATERRADVGLMKALGGTIARIVGLFLAELGVLGAAGGVIGCAAGVALAEWIGRRVFGAAISPRWEIFPLTIALMIVVAMAGALPLQRLGKVKPAVILRGE